MNYSKSAGITTETDYPYTAETGTCQPDKIKPVATIDGYVKLPTNDYDALMTAVATIGPIASSVSADWAFYLAGVYNGECGWVIDHVDGATMVVAEWVRQAVVTQLGGIAVARCGEPNVQVTNP